MKATNLEDISEKDLTRKAQNRLYSKYQRQLCLDCLNLDIVLYKEFKNKLKNIKKANISIRVYQYLELKYYSTPQYSKDNLKEHYQKKNKYKKYKGDY